jgi:hypothetical protein
MMGTSTHDRTPRRRLMVAAGALVVVAILMAFAIGTTGSNERRAPTATTGPPMTHTPVGPSGPAEERDGMPVGYSRDETGAVSAAIAFATASQRWLYFGDEEVEAAVRAIATPSSADDLVASVVSEVSEAREQLGESPGRVWWLVRPLAWSVLDRSDERATVEVWAVTVLSAAEVAAPQAEWGTFTVDLAWSGGDWTLDDIRNTPGPTPMVGPGDRPWDAIPFDRALDGFVRLDGEPVR